MQTATLSLTNVRIPFLITGCPILKIFASRYTKGSRVNVDVKICTFSILHIFLFIPCSRSLCRVETGISYLYNILPYHILIRI